MATGRRRIFARLARALAWIGFAACILIALAWWYCEPAMPDAFYSRVSDPVAPAGTLIASEPFTRDVPDNARAWRILYATTRADNTPAVASAIVMVSRQPATDSRPIIAWAHGTTGIAAGCAPSVMEHPFDNVPALQPLLDAGWAYVATDYIGLGVQGGSGGHAYLVGDEAARAVLDAVRAARRMGEPRLDDKLVVWGHSQGGHSALWAGMRASDYAPELKLAGIAAFAPASDLRELVEDGQSTILGKIVSAYVMRAYSAAYPDVRPGDYMGWWSRTLAGDIARRCLGGKETLFSVAETALLPRGGAFWQDAASGPLGARLEQNTPRGAINAPLLIAQGEDDDAVLPRMQQAYVKSRCAAGQPVDFLSYPGVGHLSLVAEGSPLTADLMTWTRDRFAGAPAAPGCVD
ncbi:lipase family protein [Mesorhizobium sp. PAMC28654]|uniref:lipase family protein n=1 Tax=Mesorhizobium sp. PAMC28654 TaxID=2880934 RepID=UPI001D0A5C68|nr:lipase family protein [Mesorhizobium sp. PAMC28654]UDL89196.1 lipase family protein [Mesorhizobium sp. PAMC28654]